MHLEPASRLNGCSRNAPQLRSNKLRNLGYVDVLLGDNDENIRVSKHDEGGYHKLYQL